MHLSHLTFAPQEYSPTSYTGLARVTYGLVYLHGELARGSTRQHASDVRGLPRHVCAPGYGGT